MLTIPQLKSLCAQMNIRPHRRKGQHFLVDSRIPQMMMNAANVSKEDTVLEIGPGFGVLTEALLARAGKVVAVENDRRLVGYLKEKFTKEIEGGRLELIEGDAMQTQISNLKSQKYIFKSQSYAIISNIPYSITSATLTTFLDPRKVRVPERMVLMIQKEVAERIVAKPPRMSRLAVFVQFHAEVEYLATVPRSLFWPEPEVDSAVVLIAPHPHPRIKYGASSLPQGERETKNPLALPRRERVRVRVGWNKVEPFVAAGFRHPRKQLHSQIVHLFGASMGARAAQDNKLSGLPRPDGVAKEILAACGVSLTARPGELSVEQWKCLAISGLATSGS